MSFRVVPLQVMWVQSGNTVTSRVRRERSQEAPKVTEGGWKVSP